MTNQNAGTPNMSFLPSLGGGRILSETFSIFFGGFFRIFPIGIAILFVSYAIVYLIYGDLGQNIVGENGNFLFGKVIIANIVIILGNTIFMSVLILSANDYKFGHPLRVGGYFHAAFTYILPLVILQIAYGIGVGIGMILLVIPGLYLLAMWSVYLPAILIDQVGFNGLSRSTTLTRGYRWSIMGVLVVLIMVAYSIIIITSILAAGGFEAMINPQLGQVSWFSVLAQSVGGAFGAGLLTISSLVIFNRLKEIKESGGVTTEIAQVFD